MTTDSSSPKRDYDVDDPRQSDPILPDPSESPTTPPRRIATSTDDATIPWSIVEVSGPYDIDSESRTYAQIQIGDQPALRITPDQAADLGDQLAQWGRRNRPQ